MNLQLLPDPSMESSAEFSEDGLYRYTLTRIWDSSKPFINYVGLNPSIAAKVKNDPTSTRWIKRTMLLGFGGYVATNAFAFCATKPKDMLAAIDPIGPRNDEVLKSVAQSAGLVIACWGCDGKHLGRGEIVRQMLTVIKPLHALVLTKDGQPGHPLYLSYKLQPFEWSI